MANTEIVKIQLPNGEIQPVEVPSGMADDAVRSMLQKSHPELFTAAGRSGDFQSKPGGPIHNASEIQPANSLFTKHPPNLRSRTNVSLEKRADEKSTGENVETGVKYTGAGLAAAGTLAAAAPAAIVPVGRGLYQAAKIYGGAKLGEHFGGVPGEIIGAMLGGGLFNGGKGTPEEPMDPVRQAVGEHRASWIPSTMLKEPPAPKMIEPEENPYVDMLTQIRDETAQKPTPALTTGESAQSGLNRTAAVRGQSMVPTETPAPPKQVPPIPGTPSNGTFGDAILPNPSGQQGRYSMTGGAFSGSNVEGEEGTGGLLAQKPIESTATPTPDSNRVSLVPENTPAAPGTMASVPRDQLETMAQRGVPGAAEQLKKLGQPLLYIPKPILGSK